MLDRRAKAWMASFVRPWSGDREKKKVLSGAMDHGQSWGCFQAGIFSDVYIPKCCMVFGPGEGLKVRWVRSQKSCLLRERHP